MTTIRRAAVALATLLLVAVLPVVAGEGETPSAVFEQLKAMEGTWHAEATQVAGEPVPEEGAPAADMRHEFKVTGAGSVVLETMGAGTDHEMVNAYFMDGEDLVLTHYCAGGNQPTMKLDRDLLAEGTTHFAFTGGTNLDPETDHHIHSTVLDWREDGSLVESWSAWGGGEETAVMEFVLTPAE